jgi:hypothetical protein
MERHGTPADRKRLSRGIRSDKVPVLMAHGMYDPHPRRLISAGLRPYLPQLEYRELEHCGTIHGWKVRRPSIFRQTPHDVPV